MDVRQLQDTIQGFRLDDGPLGSQGYERVLLQLFGYTGHGKSSFINSCKYVLTDGEDFTELAKARLTDGGHTMVRTAYPLTDTITLVDNRGYNTMDGFQKAEVYAQLGNFIQIGKRVDWRDNFKAMMEEIEESEEEPNHTDFIVPIFIYSAAYQLGKQKEDISKFMVNCVKMTGVVPIVVLTMKSSANYFETDSMFKQMRAENVIPVENYTKDSLIKTLGRTTDILMVIDCALRNVRYRMGQLRNPRRERIERKKFLLNYIHDAVRNKEEQERIKAEATRQQETERKGICILF